jgi:hypothetical protein
MEEKTGISSSYVIKMAGISGLYKSGRKNGDFFASAVLSIPSNCLPIPCTPVAIRFAHLAGPVDDDNHWRDFETAFEETPLA